MRLVEPYRTSLLVLAAFALGAVAGGSLVRYLTLRAQVAAFEAGPEQAQQRVLTTVLGEELDLDADQLASLEAILRERAREDRDLRAELEPRLAPRRAAMRQRVRAILRQDQRERFDAFADRYEARIASWLASSDPTVGSDDARSSTATEAP